MIYNTKHPRNRLILELQARCGLRIGELLNIKAQDVSERKLTIKQPKSGKEAEVAFMPEQIRKTTQTYLGKVSEHEAIRWMDILHDK